MTTVTIRQKGQFTIPISIREELDIQENDIVTITPWGEKAFLVIPQKLKSMEILKKSAALAKAKGITLEEMLAELDEIRHKA